MRPVKPKLNVAFTGHVDHGKSSLIGRLLLSNGDISEREYEKYTDEATSQGRADAGLSFISDERKEERERGLSIAPSFRRLDGSTFDFTLIDCPGHNYYTGNMIKGVSQADATVLVVSAKDGVQPLTKEHALISNVMSGEDLIVTISKMDTVNFEKSTYEAVREDVAEIMETITDAHEDITYVPTSATEERNVASNCDPIEWYDGESLLEQLEELEEPPERDEDPFRMPVDDKHTMSGIGTTIAGTVRSGGVRVDQSVVFQPSGTECEVRSIEMFHETLAKASARDNVGMNLTGTNTSNVEPGEVCGNIDDPPSSAAEVVTELTVVQQPPEIKPGVRIVFHAHSLQTPCEVMAVETLEEENGNDSAMNVLAPGETGRVKLRFPRQEAIETFEESPSLGKFLLRDNNETLGYGKVMELK